MAIQKITADVISSDAITTNSISDSAITAAKLAGTLDLTGKTITVATASSGDNDTSIASTAFVQQELASLVDSAPGTLNTLNELAAALGDDASFSTTVTNSIALKAPLASPDFTGDVTFDTSTLVVDATNDRVGIGTTSPNAPFKLDVEGAVRTNGSGFYVSANYSSTNNVYKIYENSNEFRIESQIYGNANAASSPIVFATSNTDGRLARMTIDASGNVQIGTSSHVNLSGSATELTIGVSGDTDNSGGGISFAHNGSTLNGYILGQKSSLGVGSQTGYTYIVAGGTERMRIANGGDISFYEDTGTTAKLFWDASAESLGIGTSSPTYPFHLTGNGDTVAAVTAGASSVAALNLGNSTNLADGGIRYDNSADALIFRASNAEKMRIDNAGNVIIGTTNDGAPGLTIEESRNLSFGTGNDNESYVNFFRQASSAAAVMATGYRRSNTANKMESSHSTNWAKSAVTANYGTIRFYTDAASADAVGTTLTPTERMRIDSSGNVGIGTDTPNQWASYTDNAATVLQVQDTSRRARMVINGGNGAHLDLVDYAGGTNDKHLNFAVDGGIGKFGSLNDAGNAFVQNNIMVMDLGTGNVGIGNSDPSSPLEVGNGSSTYVKIRNASSGDVSSGYTIVSGSTTTTSLYGNAGEGWTTLLSGGSLAFRVNNASSGFNPMNIDTSGRVTMPYQPAFHAYGPAGSIADGSVVIPANTYVNRGSYYSTSNGRFTAPVAGVYLFFWSAIGNNTNDVYRWFLHKNGSATGIGGNDVHLRQDTSATGSEYATNGSRVQMVSLSANDYVYIYFDSDGGTAAYYQSDYVNFGGYLIG